MIVLYILLGIILFFALLFSFHIKVFLKLEDISNTTFLAIELLLYHLHS